MFKECIGCLQKRLGDEPEDDRSNVLCPICRMTRYYNAYKKYITSKLRSKSKAKRTSIERKLRKFMTNKFHITTKLYALKQLTSSHKLKEYSQVKLFLLSDRQIKFIFNNNKNISSRLCLREIERLEYSDKAQEELLQLEETSSSCRSSDNENNDEVTEVPNRAGNLAEEQPLPNNQNSKQIFDTNNNGISHNVIGNGNNEDTLMNDIDNNEKSLLHVSDDSEVSQTRTGNTVLSTDIAAENSKNGATDSVILDMHEPLDLGSRNGSWEPSRDVSPPNEYAFILEELPSTVKSPSSLLAPDPATAEKPISQDTTFTGHVYKLKPSKIAKPSHNERTNDAQLHLMVQNLRRNLSSIVFRQNQSPNTDMNDAAVDTTASPPITNNLPEQNKTTTQVEHSRQTASPELAGSIPQSHSSETSTLIDNTSPVTDPAIQTTLSPTKRFGCCKRPKPSDMPPECLSFSTCPRCLIRHRLHRDTLQALSKVIKLYGFYQMHRYYNKDKEYIKLAMERDPYLEELGSRTFDYSIELEKLRAEENSKIEQSQSQQNASINLKSATNSNSQSLTDLEVVETNNQIFRTHDVPQQTGNLLQQESSFNRENSAQAESLPIQENIASQANVSNRESSLEQNEIRSDQHTASNENALPVEDDLDTLDKHAEVSIKPEDNVFENDTGHSNDDNPATSDKEEESGHDIEDSNNNENADTNTSTHRNSSQDNVADPNENTHNNENDVNANVEDNAGIVDVQRNSNDKREHTESQNKSDSISKVEYGDEAKHIIQDSSTNGGDKQKVTNTGSASTSPNEPIIQFNVDDLSRTSSLNSSIQEIPQIGNPPVTRAYSAPIQSTSSFDPSSSQPTNVLNSTSQNIDVDKLITTINNTTMPERIPTPNNPVLHGLLPNQVQRLNDPVTTGSVASKTICSICKQIREPDEPFPASKSPSCPKCTLKVALLKGQSNTVFGVTKLYALKQVYEWQNYSSFQLRTMFLDQDMYLSQFNTRPFNFVCEMIRLLGPPSPYRPFQPPEFPLFLQRMNRVCQKCNASILDAFNEMKNYSCCAKCTLVDGIANEYSHALLNSVKILALKQVLEGNTLEDNQLVLKFLFDKFLQQYKGKKFDYEIELLKYKTGDENYDEFPLH